MAPNSRLLIAAPSVSDRGFVQSSHHAGVSHRAVTPATLVRRAAVEITAEPVFEEEGVEVEQEPLAQARNVRLHARAVVFARVVFAIRRTLRLCVVTADRRLLWWFWKARALAAQLGPVALVARHDERKESAAEEACATLRYWWHLVPSIYSYDRLTPRAARTHDEAHQRAGRLSPCPGSAAAQCEARVGP
jgi:hypothetical protein